jgi:catechol 2,3-dioxygenase-like lactoylglutathione lyase family enzyme
MTASLNAIGLIVADMPATVAFYRLLGLPFESDSNDHEDCEFAPGIRLLLDTESMMKSLFPDWTKPTGGPQVALAFQVESPAAVDDKVAELAKAGHRVVKEPYDAFWGQRYATVHDPDGNAVDLYAPLPS